MHKRLILAAPLLIVPAAYWLLGRDASVYLLWWLLLLLNGFLWWPLTAGRFPRADYGWLFSKAFGLALSALIAFTLQHITPLPFSAPVLILLSLCTGLLIWFYPVWQKPIRNRFAGRLSNHEPPVHVIRQAIQDGTLQRVAILELLFAAVLLLWTFARGLKPDLDSLEKFMNIGFMNSIWRADSLPAMDMWFSGERINYYYFGHYAYTWMARVGSVPTSIAYQLGMATTFALTAALSASVVLHLTAVSENDTRMKRAHWNDSVRLSDRTYARTNGLAWIGAFLAAILVTAGGNGHAFLFHEGSPGYGFLKRIGRNGLPAGISEKVFWFADSTRFIGYNPDTADKTIHEFPYYSFLVADLHAHVINLAFVLVLIGLLVSWIRRPAVHPPVNVNGGHSFTLLHPLTKIVCEPAYWLFAALLAIFMMGNYWDFVIYFALTSIVLWLAGHRSPDPRITWKGLAVSMVLLLLLGFVYLNIAMPWLTVILAGLLFLAGMLLSNVVSDGLYRAVVRSIWLFFLTHLIALPFNSSFEPISKTIARTVHQTSLFHFLVLWGPHLVAGLFFVLFLLAAKSPPRLRKVFPPIPGQEQLAMTDRKPIGLRIRRFAAGLTAPDQLVLLFLIMGIVLLLLPELVYVVDIYGGEYKRANTMFKFTYQAFVLLSLSWAYAIPCFLRSDLRRNVGRIAAGILTVALVIPLWYPFAATSQWLGQFERSRYQGLDGLTLFAIKDSAQIDGNAPGELAADVAAIRWLNQEIKGQPVVLEAFGDSYTDYNRISAFTGLPTVIGWQTHEWLWRTSRENPDAYGDIVLPRQEDVRRIYTTQDASERRELLRRYNVAYIVTGALEREKFSVVNEDGERTSLVQDDLLFELGPVVFEQESLRIIKVED